MKQTIGLRTLLVLLAFVAIAPGIGVLTYLSVVVQREELVKAQEDLEAVGNLVAANQEQLVEGVRQMLTVVANGPSVRRTGMRDLCVEFMRNIQSSGPIYANIGYADLQGDVQCQGVISNQGINISGRRHFRTVIETGKFAVGDYVIGMASKRKVLAFGMPVFNERTVLQGVVFAAVDLAFADRQLNSVMLPKNMRVYVSDARGHIIVSSDKTVDLVGTLVPDTTLEKALIAGQMLAFAAPDAAGVNWLHAVKPISGVGQDPIMVAVSIRRDDAVATAKKRFRIQLSIMAAAALFGFVLASLFARRFIAIPIRHLLDRMRQVEQGEARTLVPDRTAPANAEFAELDSRFSSMLAKLQTNQYQLQKAQQITRIGFFELDLQTMYYKVISPVIYEIFGLDPADGPVSQVRYRSMVHPDDLAIVDSERSRLFSGEKPMHLEYRIIRTDGGVRWLDAFGFVDRDEHGRPAHYTGALQDITERKLSELRAHANEHRFRLLFEHSLDGVLQTASNGAILAANAAACQIFGMSEARLCDLGRTGVVAPDDPRLARLLAEREASGHARGELTMVRGDGSRFEAELTSSVYADGEGNQLTSIILRDITARIRSEKDIHQLAFFDALTGLPNRRLLLDHLTLMLAAAQRNGEVGAVLFIDLDHFKNVNDARGHATGDALLQHVAQRLSALMRGEDTVARIGGDEFVILIPRLAADLTDGAHHAMAVAGKALHALTQPFVIDDQPYNTGASIGVTLLPKNGQTTEDLLREADTAMYRAKSAGRNQVVFFQAAMQAEVEERLALENDLIHAVGTAQLEMALQPQFDHSGVPRGCELLMRWTHPVRGAVSPAVFIPIAEESGLILTLGDWVVQQGCRALLRLHGAGHQIPVSVNISPRQFRQPDFVSRVKVILAETAAPATDLIFEVTEGLLIEDLDATIERMNELAALGIRFSIDDFGTGYSSLGYLRRLPLHELKIDRSFVHGTPHETGNSAIVQMILAMANNLGIHVVAEGVETPDQAQFLQEAGCDLLQGYLLGRPMTIDRWLERTLTSLGRG
ncbi:MAG: EAL domain-containing protein [Herminiimonas sp.]|nr:EAL domain-containing protein [Herminiimonas sp.]